MNNVPSFSATLHSPTPPILTSENAKAGLLKVIRKDATGFTIKHRENGTCAGWYKYKSAALLHIEQLKG